MNRIEKQKYVIKEMIKLFCKRNHKTQSRLCSDCNEVLNYAFKRLDNCVFGNEKPNCNKCKIHCYKPDMKQRIKKVMKFSGPRMIIYNPKLVIDHFFDEFKYKNKKK